MYQAGEHYFVNYAIEIKCLVFVSALIVYGDYVKQLIVIRPMFCQLVLMSYHKMKRERILESKINK